MIVSFNDIRIFAVTYFYAWENGEDFDWLKKEWRKFAPHINDKKEAEDFILVLAYIYSAFCHESFFLKSKEGIMTVREYANDLGQEHPEFVERINKKIDFTLELLLKAYHRPVVFLRELVSIAIGFELPHPDGYEYIKELFKNKYNEPDIDKCYL
jgi:hypothetical protein